jgi:hypothetical protein
MSTSELQVTYWTDEDYTGLITATAKSGQFSAQGAAWFGQAHVKRTFLAKLRAFPLSAVNPPMLEGGFWSANGPDECHHRILIKPYDIRGTLLVRVDVSSESRKTPDADMQQSATIRFLTEYAAVDAFARDFELVLDGKRQTAVLSGI